jgi:hypothetical protein
MMVTVALAAAVAATGCRGSAAGPEVDPVTMADATAFSARFLKAVNPCDRGKLDAVFDADAFGARFRHGDSTLAIEGAVGALKDKGIASQVLCAWQANVESYQLLHIRMVDGQPHPVFRRITRDERTKVTAVNYDELMLGMSRRDHKVRAIDIYSYIAGQWLSELLRSTTDAALSAADGMSEATALADKLKQARALQQAGKPQEALALVDSLPPSVRRTRVTQAMRVALGNAISEQAYGQALDEIAAVFPGDPSVALVEIDGALLRKDYAAALRYIDQVDHAIGGDAWQDAIRAEVLIKRGGAGDLDAALARAKAAVATEPTLAKGWWAVLDVAMARHAWSDALAAMDELHGRFQILFRPETLQKSPVYAGLVASPEYAAWQAKRD